MKISIIGSGSFGTSLSVLLNENNHIVHMYAHRYSTYKKLITERKSNYLKQIKIPNNIQITNNIEEATKNQDAIILSVPSIFIRDIAEKIKPFVNKNQTIIIASKGFEKDTLLTLSEVVKDVLQVQERDSASNFLFEKKKATICKIGVISGPTHAEELAKKLPTTCVASSIDIQTAEFIQDIFMNSYFRLYTNTDVLGVELAGALKNVIALGCGILDGMGYGDNTKAALITRGIKEISQLGTAMQTNINTYYGLAGIGDLIVTCTSKHSRNLRAGILLGKGKTIEEAKEEIGMVIEGANASTAAYELSLKYNVDMPIVTEVNNILLGLKKPNKAIEDLMSRKKRTEN